MESKKRGACGVDICCFPKLWDANKSFLIPYSRYMISIPDTIMWTKQIPYGVQRNKHLCADRVSTFSIKPAKAVNCQLGAPASRLLVVGLMGC